MNKREVIITTKAVYAISKDVIRRKVEDKVVLIPLFGGNNIDVELFTISKTGKVILDKLDGTKSLEKIIKELAMQFDTPLEEIERDVMQLIKELLARKLIVKWRWNKNVGR